MEQRKINLSETAYADLESIEIYIAQDSPTIARNFINHVFERVEQLYAYPESGRVVPEFNNKKIRELLLKKYRIVYQILSEEEFRDYLQESKRAGNEAFGSKQMN